jgi:signal peptidase I
MNDEESGPDRLAAESGSQDPDGTPDRSDSPAGYRGAVAGETYGHGATAQPAFGGATATGTPGGAPVGGATATGNATAGGATAAGAHARTTAGDVLGESPDAADGGRYRSRHSRGQAPRTPGDEAPTAQYPTAQYPTARHTTAAGWAGQVPPGQGPPGQGPPGQWQSEPAGEPAPGEPSPDQVAEDQEAAKAAAVRRKNRSTWRELPILIVVALVIALVIKTFVVQPFFIPSSSMEDTLLVGDKVLVNKLVYHFRSIQPGDIIVFNGVGSWNPAAPATKPPSDPLVRAYDATLRPLFHSIAGLFGTPVGQTDYIKRVIGTPGDHVVCCNAQGLVTVNGVPLHESSYLYPGAAPSAMHFNIVVPPGRLWVMGDNRAVSDDSRLRQSDPGHGTIPENEVIGRAFVIVWPPGQWKFLPIPSTFNQPGIDRPASGSAASRQTASQEAAEAALLGAKVKPEPSYLPVAVGLVAAVPLTWLQRRTRRRLMRKLRERRGNRSR